MIDDFLKAISEVMERYFAKIASHSNPSVIREFVRKTVLGFALLLPAVCGVILFAVIPNFVSLTFLVVCVFLTFPWVVFWLDVKETYEKLQGKVGHKKTEKMM